MFSYVITGMANQTHRQLQQVAKISQEVKTVRAVSQEYKEILSSLEEAIIVFKDKEINYSNHLFNTIMEGLETESQKLDQKTFKVYRQEEELEQKSQEENLSQQEHDKFCLRQLIDRDQSFFEDKIFELLIPQEEAQFKFVQLKVKRIKRKAK